jgi:hypothetical protein
MTPPNHWEERITQLVSSWQLEQARDELREAAEDLSDLALNDLEDLLRNRERLEDELEEASNLISDNPEQALAVLRGLPSLAQNHPSYSKTLRRAEEAYQEKQREQAIDSFSEIVKDIENRLYDDAENKLQEARLTLDLEEAPEILARFAELEQEIDEKQYAEEKLLRLDQALEDEDWTSANSLFNSLSGIISDQELASRKKELEKLRIRASGESTRRKYDSEIENLRAALESVVNVKNWRAAYNNLSRLVEKLQQQGETAEAKRQSEKLTDYYERLEQKVQRTIGDRLDEADNKLEEGLIDQAKALLHAAIQTGDAPEPAEGQPLDRAGNIMPDEEQGKEIARLQGEIRQYENARREADQFMKAASTALRKRTLSDLYNARENLRRVRGIDPNYPGLQILENAVEKQITTKIEAQVQIFRGRFDRAINEGDSKTARDVVEEISSLDVPPDEIQDFQDKIAEVEERCQNISRLKSKFYHLFEQTQDEVDCEALQPLPDILEKWEEVAYEPHGVNVARAKLRRFEKQCEELSKLHQTLTHAIQSPGDVDTHIDEAVKLAGSLIGNRPAIAKLLVKFWQAMAERHGSHGADLEYIRKAQKFAALTEDEKLKSRLATQAEKILSATQAGKHLANVDQRLRTHLESDLAGGLIFIQELQDQNDSALSDPAISQYISQIRNKAAQEEAEALTRRARQLYEEGNLEEALSQINQAIDKKPLLSARTLFVDIAQQLSFEKRQLKIFEHVLQLEVTSDDLPSSQQSQDLIEAKATAEEIEETQQVSPKLMRKAKSVIELYNQWENYLSLRIKELEHEIEDRIDNLEFKEAYEAIQEVGKAGISNEDALQLIRLRHRVSNAERLGKRINTRLEKAERIASKGRFNEAMRLVAVEASETPQSLQNICKEYQDKWKDDVNVFTELGNDLPVISNKVRILLLVNQGETTSMENISEVSARVGEKFQQAVNLDLEKKNRVRRSYHFLQESLTWLRKVLETAQKVDINESRIEERKKRYTSLIQEWQSLGFGTDKIPAGMEGITVAAQERKAWVENRIDVLDTFIKAVQESKGVGSFRFSILSPFREVKKELNRPDLDQLMIPSEAQMKDTLLDEVKEQEKRQIWNTALLLTLPILVITLSINALRPKPDPIPVPLVPTDTPKPTQTPIIVTTTPTITPTPTDTPTPTPTPIIAYKCHVDYQRWLMLEPGCSQGNVGCRSQIFVRRNEEVGILRDVPDDSDLRGQWVRIVRLDGSESKGWFNLDWFTDCDK